MDAVIAFRYLFAVTTDLFIVLTSNLLDPGLAVRMYFPVGGAKIASAFHGRPGPLHGPAAVILEGTLHQDADCRLSTIRIPIAVCWAVFGIW